MEGRKATIVKLKTSTSTLIYFACLILLNSPHTMVNVLISVTE